MISLDIITNLFCFYFVWNHLHLFLLNVKVVKKTVQTEILSILPTRASKRTALQGGFQDLDKSTSTSFQRLDSAKSSLTKEQLSETTQQIQRKVSRKVKDEIQNTEKTIF